MLRILKLSSAKFELAANDVVAKERVKTKIAIVAFMQSPRSLKILLFEIVIGS